MPDATRPPLDRSRNVDGPYPGSLCHACAAPPRYVTSDRGSVFVYCPLLRRYPPQPVVACEHYRPRAVDAAD